MFKLIECDRRYKFVLLRCQKCNDGNAFDNENFEVLERNKVIIKREIKITCPTCGNSQPVNKRLITLEPQPVSYQFTDTKARPAKGLFHRFIDSMANMTQDEILSVSNQIAAFNTDFSDSSD